jgi:hypothetical protein
MILIYSIYIFFSKLFSNMIRCTSYPLVQNLRANQLLLYQLKHQIITYYSKIIPKLEMPVIFMFENHTIFIFSVLPSMQTRPFWVKLKLELTLIHSIWHCTSNLITHSFHSHLVKAASQGANSFGNAIVLAE